VRDGGLCQAGLLHQIGERVLKDDTHGGESA
jgi:hypothetical protein